VKLTDLFKIVIFFLCVSTGSGFALTCPGGCPDGAENSYRVWFVNNTNTVSGDGSYGNPFQALKSAEAASLPCDIIYVFPGNGMDTHMNEGIILKDNQKLLGTSIAAFQLCPTGDQAACGLPKISNSATPMVNRIPTIQLANNNTIEGIFILDEIGSAAMSNLVTMNDAVVPAVTAPITGVNVNNCSIASNTNGIYLSECPNLGAVNILDNSLSINFDFMSGSIPSEGAAIVIISCGNALVDCSNNDFNGTMEIGIIITGLVDNINARIVNNEMNFEGFGGIELVNGPLITTRDIKCKLFADVEDNRINISQALSIRPGSIAGITASLVQEHSMMGVFVNGLQIICVRLHDNAVNVPYRIGSPTLNSNGYLFFNGYPDPTRLRIDMNNGNTGSIATNVAFDGSTDESFVVGVTPDCTE